MTKKAHCANHKRYVHNCVGCQSEALKETVGFPKHAETEATTDAGIVGGGGTSEAAPEEEEEDAPHPDQATGTNPDGTVSDAPASSESDDDDDEEGGDIAEWEPEVDEEELPPRPSEEPPNHPDPWADGKTPAEGDDTGNWKPPAEREPVPVGGMFPPKDIDETEEAMAAEGEFDEGGNLQEVSLTPGEGEPLIPTKTPPLAARKGCTECEGECQGHDDSGVSPLEMAMLLFPARLIPEGATEVCDEERPDEPYMASYEELVRRAVAGYLEVGLTPEDAVIVVAADVIHAEQLGGGYDPMTEEEQDETDQEAFDAGLEASPELTGCIEDYNNGFNTGMDTLLETLTGYYGGDTDAPAFSMLEWLRVQVAGMKK